MLHINILSLGKTLKVRERAGMKLIDYLHEAGVDWMHACGKKGNCTSCSAWVIDSMENLNKPTDAESRFQRRGKLKDGQRLCCQCEPNGDINIRVVEQFKLPHLNYND
ncbi:MAG: (2Fe-2S)-binding protein [Cyclobacteriaceae bacterium]|nr:(2Fe-2S)-binding protein [Cyclobacteriaceae bacterium]MCH8514996.1 (2Fe-2S)-binding protein [Cyclobacteriaceae bacterium]